MKRIKQKKAKTKLFLSAAMTVGLVTGFGGQVTSSYAANAPIETEYDLIDMVKSPSLVDYDFEKGGSAWSMRNKGDIASGVSYGNGTKSGSVPSGNSNSFIGQNVNVEANTDYTLTAYVKVDVPDAHVFFGARQGGDGSGSNIKDIKVAPGNTEWNRVTFDFNSGTNTKVLVQLVKWGDISDSNLSSITSCNGYIDNVTISKKGDITDTDQYEMVWADDFNEATLNTDEWGYELGSIRGVEQQHYVRSEKNTFMRNNGLVLKATDRAIEDQYKNPRGNRQVIYDSGSIRTHGKQEFLYGRIETRAKLPKGKGVFPAFWTLGSNFTLDGDINDKQGNPWSRCGEIDIMELTGGEFGTVKNKQAWGTPHFYLPKDLGGDGDMDSTGSKGQAYTIAEDYNNDYHVFGVNWSPDKIEWYVDGVVYNTLDFSNPTWGKYAKMSYSQPQYIQFNLAMGGNWPGDAGTNLDGTEFEIDYVYYAQNAEQKAAAKAYYDAAPNISGLKDITMTQGEVPNLLEGITSDKETFVDFSVDNEYMFKNEGGLTNVDRVCSGKDDASKLAALPAGKYNIHYTAIPNDAEYVGGVPNREKEYKMTRRTVLLTVEERTFPKDATLNGVYGEKLSSVTLPTDWSWDQPDTVMSNADTEYTVNYEKNGFTTTAKVKVQLVSADKTELESKITDAKTYLDEDTYTSDSLANLQAKIDAAQAVVNKSDATEAEVASALTQLNNAMIALEKKPVTPPVDKTELESKITDAKTYLDEDTYTSDSLANLQAKIDAAQAVVNKLDATEAEVATALTQLNNAMTALEKKPVTPPVENVYEIIEDKEQTVEQGESITFKSNAPIEKFKEVLIDGKVLDKTHYTVKEGSTIVVLAAEYTKLLSSGEHTLTIVSTDGQATTQFTIETAAPSEKPGDEPTKPGDEPTKPGDEPTKPGTDKPTVKPETADNTNISLLVSLTTVAFAGIWAFFKRNKNEA